MNCFLSFLIPLLALLQLSELQARTVIVAKRETAQVYSLQLTNRLTQESTTLHSKDAVFELPENLEGEYAIQVSFTDKWGREIPGVGPKIIQLINKTKIPEAPTEESLHRVVGIVFATPYSASGTYQADLNDSLTTAKKTSGTFQSIGINTILKISSIQKWQLGLDIMQGQNKITQLNTTELSILYDWQRELKENRPFEFFTGASFVSSQVKDAIQEGGDTINTNAAAQSSYIFGQGIFTHRMAKSTLSTTGRLGFSNSYFRYHLGQSILYTFTKRFSLGPWVDYSKFENGNKNGAMRANILKLGVSFNFSL
jgi:hypothetical protein